MSETILLPRLRGLLDQGAQLVAVLRAGESRGTGSPGMGAGWAATVISTAHTRARAEPPGALR